MREYLFTSPIDTFHVSLFIRSSSVEVPDLNDLEDKRIAVVRSNIAVGYIPEANEVVYDRVESALLALLAGDVDGLLYPAPVILYMARKAELDHQLVEVSPHILEVKRAMAIARNNTEFYRRLEPAVQKLLGSQEYQTIYRKWHPAPKAYWNV